MITLRVIAAKNILKKIQGLIGQEKQYPFLLKTRFGIHTFFLRNPIDVLVLDYSNRVVKTKQNLAPNQIFLWNPRYSTIIELPGGTIQKKKIKIGEKISIESA